MEEKKLDINSVIGFVLIFGILMYMLWQNQPTPEELKAQEKAKQEQVEKERKANSQEQTKVATAQDFSASGVSDSLQLVNLKNKLGAFAYSAAKASTDETRVESDLLALKFNNRGGYLSEVKVKNHTDFKNNPIYIIKDNNASFNINFGTTDSRILNTKDLYFQPTVTKKGNTTVLPFYILF